MTADRYDRTSRFYDLYDLPRDSLGGACRSGKGRCPCPPAGQAPDPDQAARLSRSQIAAAVTRARRYRVEERAAAMQQAPRAPALRQPAPVQAAYAAVVQSQAHPGRAVRAGRDAG